LTGALAPSNLFKVVVFDYDGTLFDTRAAIVHCITRTFAECGRRIPPCDVVSSAVRTGAALPDTLQLLDRRLQRDRPALDELVVTYRRLYRDEGTALLRAFPEATQTLRQLGRGGAKCIVVSNKGIEAIRRSLDETRLSHLVDLVLGDQPGLPKKPDPAIMTEFILPKYPQLGRNDILMVGDTEIDILFAKGTGVSCCWASYGYGDPARCRTLAPDYEISSLGELHNVVLGVGT
jgi:phosphoglycolate phosphatase